MVRSILREIPAPDLGAIAILLSYIAFEVVLT
jgi:hypothetical protein